ncbi:ADR404Cp [Eremothecium gossypii ATCC 10895]|uniref:ADR404Cp n=1 Tax=Eremothecium gossypii (strain ATCC 10895 / CBS 109.51 / FGSC 9923 / NRRL Y-1056) TaxID=284811 RepID=Q758X4_EREGS|nr:ADR404Cp [Eremothecium gossypii ATCC 10895]AAS52323.1 ADR404Cp [Eremothecium gossypii ATCC 10895]AEY96620.1 FADR404Cp [Eremothecium gossypii FDAG1]
MSSIPTSGSVLKPNTHKRKLSYVCIPCRKCKTKCDKLKPTCSRCAELGLYCGYDIEKQLTEDPSDKIQKLEGLERELEYWKEKTRELELLEARGIRRDSAKLRTVVNIASGISGNDFETEVDELSFNCYVNNVFRVEPERTWFKGRRLAFLLANRMLDRYMTPLFDDILQEVDAAIARDKSVNPLSPDEESVQYAVLERELFVESQLPDYMPSIRHFIECLRKNQEKQEVTRTGLLYAIALNSMDSVCIEDINLQQRYSTNLQEILEQCEKVLPSYEAIEFYKVNFYKHVYPLVPVLEIPILEECLAEILEEGPNGRVRLMFGKYRLRHKLINLAILLVMLIISQQNVAGASAETTSMLQRPENQLSKELVFLSQMCVAHLDVTHQPEEQHMTCLLLLWYVSVLDPEFRSETLLQEEADALLSLILNMGMELGLGRDPEEYYQFRDMLVHKSLINYRRKLGICIMPLVLYHSEFTSLSPTNILDFAVFENIVETSADAVSAYLDRVAADMVQQSAFELEVHRVTCLRHIVSKWIEKLNKLNKCSSSSMKLCEVEQCTAKVLAFINSNFPLNNVSAGPSPAACMLDLGYRKVDIDWPAHMSIAALVYHIACRAILVQLELSLACCIERTSKAFSGYLARAYQRRILNATATVFTIFNICAHHHTLLKSVPPTHSHRSAASHVVHVAADYCAYAVLSLYVRFEHAVYFLGVRLAYPAADMQLPVAQDNATLGLLSRITDLYSEIANHYYEFVENGLSTAFYSTFKNWLLLRRFFTLKKSGLTLHGCQPDASHTQPGIPPFAYSLEDIAALLATYTACHEDLAHLLEKTWFTLLHSRIAYIPPAFPSSQDKPSVADTPPSSAPAPGLRPHGFDSDTMC